ncbi:hypothetical protein AAFN86_19645 [Roseomonas sp. CAU 1739]|uniref:hypothetical protein n=1 Tax=Roseomonas sp. CAU 1739 TaxID=3140364 RepID=UPI00325BE58E
MAEWFEDYSMRSELDFRSDALAELHRPRSLSAAATPSDQAATIHTEHMDKPARLDSVEELQAAKAQLRSRRAQTSGYARADRIAAEIGRVQAALKALQGKPDPGRGEGAGRRRKAAGGAFRGTGIGGGVRDAGRATGHQQHRRLPSTPNANSSCLGREVPQGEPLGDARRASS